MKKTVVRPLVFALALAIPGFAHADERESLESLRATTMGLIQALVQQGVLTQQKADEVLTRAGVKNAGGLPAQGISSDPANATGVEGSRSIRVPYVPEFVKRELREQIRDEVMAKAREEHWADPSRLPDWLSRFDFAGEMTLRFQDDLFRRPCDPAGNLTTSCNASAPLYNSLTGSTLNNTTVDRQRLRLRAIEGATIKVSDTLQAEFQLTTGSSGNPVTNFQTLGSSFSAPSIALDRASMLYRPAPWLALQGGRFSNPFMGTDLLWYDRLGLDGVTVKASRSLVGGVEGFATVGAFSLQDIEPSQATSVKSKWLFGVQLGGQFQVSPGLEVKSGLGLYSFDHIEGMPNDAAGNNSLNSLSVPQFAQKGNTLFNVNGLNGGAPQYALASKFRVLDWTSRVDLSQWAPTHFVWTLDVARNLGFDQNEIMSRTAGLALDPRLNSMGQNQPLQARVRAYGTRFSLGQSRIANAGEWQAYLGYKYVQRDAVLDAFNDPDFHLGGTDAKGWLAGVSYGIDHNTWLTLKYLATDAIDGPPLSINVLQADFNIRF